MASGEQLAGSSDMADKSTAMWLHQLLPTPSQGKDEDKCNRHVTVIGLSCTVPFSYSVLLEISKEAINHTLYLNHSLGFCPSQEQYRTELQIQLILFLL